MAARDLIHEPVCKALENDGWTITDDPLTLRYHDKRIEIDLGAERDIIGAERAQEKIAVEIKSFLKASVLRDLEEAFGQYIVYLSFLKHIEPKRKLYIAVSDVSYTLFMKSQAIQMLLHDNQIPLIVVNPETEEVRIWHRN